MSALVEILVGCLSVAGALLVLVSAVAMLRERDAFARINCLSPATGLGLPLVVTAAYLHESTTSGVTLASTLRYLLTVAALLVVSSVASNVLARAAYLSGAPVHPATRPQELADHFPPGHPEQEPGRITNSPPPAEPG